jgi:prolipoprotein diacylglyceryltransferase
LLLLDRRIRFRPPALFALYVALYTGFRFYLESLRIDPSHEILGLRVNAWVSAVLFVASVLFFVWWQFLRGRQARHTPKAVPPKAMTVPRGRVRPRR